MHRARLDEVWELSGACVHCPSAPALPDSWQSRLTAAVDLPPRPPSPAQGRSPLLSGETGLTTLYAGV